MFKVVYTSHTLLAFLVILGNHAAVIECNQTSSIRGSASRTDISVSECYNLSGSSSERLGHGVLQVYMFKNVYARTVLPQLTFIRPTWSRMDSVLSVRNLTTCEYVMDNTSSIRFPYLCKVDDYDVHTLEYNVTDGYLIERRKFQFHLPFFPRRNVSDIEQWEVFVYVDVTESRTAIVYWEPAPPITNITKYQLNVTCGGGVYDIQEYQSVFSFQIPYDFTTPEMVCRFYVRPWLPSSKWGYRSSSPPVLINRGEVLHIWIVIMCSLFAALSYLSYRLYETLTLKCKHKISGSALLIYEAKTEQQLVLVCLLAQTLEEDHNVKVHLDHRDIPLTETKDPLKWLVETIPNSDYIIFFHLPKPENISCIPPGVYSSEKMATDNVFRMFENSSRILKLELDSCPCEEIWVCSKLKNRYKYILPEDLCKLVGKKDPFSSPLGARLKEAIINCAQETKSPKIEEIPKVESNNESPMGYLNQDEDKDSDEEGGTEIVISGRRRLLDSFNLDGKKSDSDSE